ncbi:MAG: peptide-methionine (S)-S-oxide reductase MsrA [Proteobacteria bacterium]|nr:peptide-methionine (S)-S-oxide reductase MsrA [Pseudomonadota bacterium]
MKKTLFAVMLYSISLPLFAATDSVIFAGGCFWCMEPPFDKLDGVVRTTSGYSGGHTENPTYKSTSSGTTGHYEVVEIEYDPAKVSYEKLLDVFWKNIDPFDDKGQFCDKGPQYRAAIFTKNDEEKKLAIKSKDALQKKLGNKATIVTEVLPAKKFYTAEDYHQNYYQKNPLRYKYYRYGCGRDNRLKQVEKIVNPEN